MAFYTACVLALLGAAMWMMRCTEQNFNSTGFFDHCPMASSLTMMFRLEEHRPLTRVVVFYTLQQNLRGALNFRPQASRSNSPPEAAWEATYGFRASGAALEMCCGPGGAPASDPAAAGADVVSPRSAGAATTGGRL